MFGYVVPLRGELKVWELDAYQAAYCGLCHTLGRRYGFLPRLLLSYDFAFLAMLLSTESIRPVTQRRRCIACPIKGKQVCRESLSLDIAADESVILTYWKLMDGVADASFWKGLPSRLLVLLLRPSYHRAAKWRPDFDSQTAACLEELRFLEKERSGSLDRTADTFARILRAAAPSTGTSDRDRAVGQLLYHVGRWIYLTDAWDDLAEDRSRGTYNPRGRPLAGRPGGTQRGIADHVAPLLEPGGVCLPLNGFWPLEWNRPQYSLPGTSYGGGIRISGRMAQAQERNKWENEL